MIFYYMALILAIIAVVYVIICCIHTWRHKRVAKLLKELLETTEWSSMMELIKDAEYVQAVVDACEMALEGNGC